MNVLIINGSPHREGNTAVAIGEMEKIFAREGVDVTRVDIGTECIRGCIACYSCYKTGKRAPFTMRLPTRRLSPALTGCFTARALISA